MKKFVCIVLLAAMVLSVVTGCSTNKRSDVNNDKIPVVIWHKWNVEEGEGEHELQVIVDKFNKSQDEIEVKLEAQPGDNFNDKVFTAVANGDGPDIFFDFATILPEYVDGGYVANIDEYIDTDSLRNRISTALWDEAWSTTDGHMHIVPIQVTAPVFFYNKTIYDKYNLSVPKTWEDVESNSRVIYEKEHISGFAVDSYIDLFQFYTYQTGATYINTNTKTVGFNTSKLQKMVERFSYATDNKYYSASFSSGSVDGDFNAGLIASFIGTCSYEPYIIPNGFKLGVAEIPQEGTEKWTAIFNRGAIVLASTPEKEAAACKFIEYFTNAENSKRWCTSIGGLSPYNDACAREDYQHYLANDNILLTASNSLDYAGITPPCFGAVTVRNEIKQMFLQVIGDVKSVEQAFSEAEKNCNKALK